MRIVHKASYVPEWINYRSRDEPSAAILWCFELLCSHRYCILQDCLNVVNVPVYHDPGSAICAIGTGHIFAVNNTQFMLVVAQSKFNVTGPLKVWANAQKVCIPLLGCGVICGEIIDGS